MSMRSSLKYIMPAALLFMGAVMHAEQENDQGTKPGIDNYILSALDLIQFRIYGESELDSEVRISADGIISLPFIGVIEIAGKTVLEARQLIYDLYDRDYFVNPQIQIHVIEYATRRVHVLGQVTNQGFVFIPPEESFSLLQAISAAGGFTRLANPRAVQLKRVGEDGEIQVNTINVDNIMKDPKARDWLLKTDDTIYVPERRI